MKSRPQLYLGTMTFAWSQASAPVTDEVATSFIKSFHGAGFTEIDCARIYSGGDSELMVGRVLPGVTADCPGLTITTKAHPSQEGGLSEAGIRGQLKASLEAMQVPSVNGYYLHQPDPDRPLAESLSTAHALIQEGLIKEVGMSNFHAVEWKRAAELCKENGWTLPAMSQALYNPINRLIEDELVPILRENGIRLVAYNPLAAGLLTGKHQQGQVAEGRFKDNPNYLDRFYKDDCFEGLQILQKACDAAQLSLLQATFSWLLFHSALQEGDAILLGASKQEHLEGNIKACEEAQPLPEPVVKAFDEAWAVCRGGAFSYWRSYSSDHPGRESLHPGASYVVKKKSTL